LAGACAAEVEAPVLAAEKAMGEAEIGGDQRAGGF
jgi:hypothetical protein